MKATKRTIPLHKINILPSDTLNTFNPEERCLSPHSTLLLVTKSRISSGIYKYQEHMNEKGRGKRRDRDSEKIQRASSFFQFSSVVLNQGTEKSRERMGQKGNDWSEDSWTINRHPKRSSNKKQLPYRRVLFRQSSQGNGSPQLKQMQSRHFSTIFEGATREGETIDDAKVNEIRYSSLMSRATLTRKGERKGDFSLSGGSGGCSGISVKMRSASKYCPWDLQSGFGKKGRF